ncbi:MAG: sulfite exporter TauE/SafE family protein [Chromatiales bacterium]|jgi:uncharacterized protein|nr:sulfite exporter TauE/SafE family protein [Chromatiales bacterium]
MADLGPVDATWVIAALAVLCATIVQTATGAGLGLIAGPALLLAMGTDAAIHVAALLNLTLSLLLLPTEIRDVPRAHVAWLTAGAIVGLPFGAWALHGLDLPTLKTVAGAVVLLGGAQLAIGARRGATNLKTWHVGRFGALAGAMTAALAIPGPAALWGLSRTALSPTAVRAGLRAFFCIAYLMTITMHAVIGLPWRIVLTASLWMTPCLLVGGIAGHFIKGRVADNHMRVAFLALLMAMGGTLLIDGVAL